MEISAMRALVGRALTCFKKLEEAQEEGKRVRSNVPSTRFPVPELVLFGLRELCGLDSWGPGEKLRWGVSGLFHEYYFSITLEKFGLRLYTPGSMDRKERENLLNSIGKAASFAESWLKRVARGQIEDGAVSIENQHLYFDRGYRFFRRRAEESYALREQRYLDRSRPEEDYESGTDHHPFRGKIQGGYLAGAMVDSYFSRLEHLFVLALPFLAFDPKKSQLLDFVQMRWGQKWNMVFGDQRTEADGTVYESLRAIRETVRNPLAHGGFAKKGMSFYFHVDGIGALPAMMSEQERSFDLLFTRIPENSFEVLCDQLDMADEFLRQSPLGPGIRFAESGLSIDFSTSFIKACTEAAKSEASLEEFIELRSYLEDKHANMD